MFAEPVEVSRPRKRPSFALPEGHATDYWEDSTPLKEISHPNLQSRRTKQIKVGDWVQVSNQCKKQKEFYKDNATGRVISVIDEDQCEVFFEGHQAGINSYLAQEVSIARAI